MKNKLALLLLLISISALGQRIPYNTNGIEGVILDWKKPTGIYMAKQTDRLQVTTTDVDLFEKYFSISYSKYKKYKRQYLGLRKDGVNYLYVRLISPQYAKTNNWKANDVLVADNPYIFDVWFNMKTHQVKF